MLALFVQIFFIAPLEPPVLPKTKCELVIKSTLPVVLNCSVFPTDEELNAMTSFTQHSSISFASQAKYAL